MNGNDPDRLCIHYKHESQVKHNDSAIGKLRGIIEMQLVEMGSRVIELNGVYLDEKKLQSVLVTLA